LAAVFDVQTKVVLAVLHTVAAVKASLRPRSTERYSAGAAIAVGLFCGASRLSLKYVRAIGHLRPSARAPAALAVGAGLAYFAGLFMGPPVPDQATRTKLAHLEELRNSVSRLRCYAQLQHVQLPEGGHHCHMVNPTGTAAAITEWLAAQPI
jgi:pimeloyl-ACP methyl ester carboxylesterase